MFWMVFLVEALQLIVTIGSDRGVTIDQSDPLTPPEALGRASVRPSAARPASAELDGPRKWPHHPPVGSTLVATAGRTTTDAVSIDVRSFGFTAASQ
jgi:hypothetical protein